MKKLFLFVLIFISFAYSANAEQLRFIQVTDIHFSQEGSNYRGRDIENSGKILQSAINNINTTENIDFVIFSGDNVDSANEPDLRKFMEIVKNISKPYYIVLGNHDVSRFEGLDKDKYLSAVKEYNKNQKSSDPYYYFFPNKEFIVIVMDGVSQMIPSTHGAYSDEDLEWLGGILDKYKKRKAIIVQHFPLIEPFVKKSHRTIDSEKYLEFLSTHKNVVSLISGHYHPEKTFINIKDGVYHINSPALVNYPHLYSIIEINYNKKLLFSEDPKFEIKTETVPVNTGI